MSWRQAEKRGRERPQKGKRRDGPGTQEVLNNVEGPLHSLLWALLIIPALIFQAETEVCISGSSSPGHLLATAEPGQDPQDAPIPIPQEPASASMPAL